jgi:hypothetical protein
MNEVRDTLILSDEGAVSQVTRGDALMWPWYEQAVPPFNHWCPIC